MPLELTLRSPPPTLVDVFEILPEFLADQTVDAICGLPIHIGNRRARLGELFDISGEPQSQRHVWRGDLWRVNGIGQGMAKGEIRIEGSVGHLVGGRMTGGMIEVAGRAGHFLGAEMRGGLIRVRGDVGNLAGAALPGGTNGQNGGAILIHGSAGNGVGQSMRRGLIVVERGVGNGCGFLMKAGTIVIGGSAQQHLGLRMVRGTIVLLEKSNVDRYAFRDSGLRRPLVIDLIDRYLAEIDAPLRLQNRGQLLASDGDMISGGKGELFRVVT